MIVQYNKDQILNVNINDNKNDASKKTSCFKTFPVFCFCIVRDKAICGTALVEDTQLLHIHYMGWHQHPLK